ncbi:MAG: ArgR family transcriptional regulator [Bacteroidales bacterium]|jgi:transcriptional regulator of arginine metabolism|nr:ArgR family transcriptional regulator [Bacteroidales bacterium]
MQKTKRLLAIEKIIDGEAVSSHEALLKKLRSRGISCTQATLSRNLREIGAGRIPDGKGGYRYSLTGKNTDTPAPSARMQVLPAITDIIDAKGLLVIRTFPGNANNTAIYIDNTSRYEIAGTIAGDDTILVIPRDGVTNHQVHNCLEVILPGLHEQIKAK